MKITLYQIFLTVVLNERKNNIFRRFELQNLLCAQQIVKNQIRKFRWSRRFSLKCPARVHIFTWVHEFELYSFRTYMAYILAWTLEQCSPGRFRLPFKRKMQLKDWWMFKEFNFDPWRDTGKEQKRMWKQRSEKMVDSRTINANVCLNDNLSERKEPKHLLKLSVYILFKMIFQFLSPHCRLFKCLNFFQSSPFFNILKKKTRLFWE